MTRYQCPFCQALHRSEDNPVCPRHGVNHSSGCAECVAAAHLAPCGSVE